MPIYVIKKGDTLWNIASEHNTTVQDIIRLNQLPNPEQLVVGQAIVLPEPKKSTSYNRVNRSGSLPDVTA